MTRVPANGLIIFMLQASLAPGLPDDLEAVLGKLNTYCQCMHGAAGAVAGYLAFGSSMDYMYSRLHVRYPLTFEVYGPDGLGKTAKGGHPRRLHADARLEPDLAHKAVLAMRLELGAGSAGAGTAGAASQGLAEADALEMPEGERARAQRNSNLNPKERALGEDPRVAGAHARRGALLREVGAGLDRAAAGGSRGNPGTLARARPEGEDRSGAAGTGDAALADADTAERTAATYAGGAAGGAEDSANCIKDYNPTTTAEYQEVCSPPCFPVCTGVDPPQSDVQAQTMTLLTSLYRCPLQRGCAGP